MPGDSILWRRLDVPGHDACALEETGEGWRLHGSAAFLEAGTPASLSYEVFCDAAWKTLAGTVRGWVGSETVDFEVARETDGTWTVNGERVADLEGCVDLDLGFTPATNLSQIRRIGLEVGEGTALPVAWLDLPAGTLEVLHQRYERRSAGAYWYEAPRFAYAALLEVSPEGFVLRYPELWEAEA
jgi:hypothetical protein